MVALELGNNNYAGEWQTTLRAEAYGDGLRVENLKPADPPNYYLGGVALTGFGTAKGVTGHASGSSTSGVGVFGQAWHPSWGTGVAGYGASVGTYGRATTAVASSYGVWGSADYPGWAGIFSGRVRVFGDLFKGGGGFCIDHPLDPENRYLQHSFVESPERLNVYSGTVVTDNDGKSVVELPEYFEALNVDFRYQLTVIGEFTQAIVSEEVRDNRFVIATKKPKVRVSWQVSGIRQDAYARATPLAVDATKDDAERGKYLHPEAFGKAKEEGVLHEQTTAFEKSVAKQPFAV